MRIQVPSLALLSELRTQCYCYPWYRLQIGLDQDPVLLWLWCRLVAASPIQPLVWELPYAAGATLKAKQNKTKAKTNKQTKKQVPSCLLCNKSLHLKNFNEHYDVVGFGPCNFPIQALFLIHLSLIILTLCRSAFFPLGELGLMSFSFSTMLLKGLFLFCQSLLQRGLFNLNYNSTDILVASLSILRHQSILCLKEMLPPIKVYILPPTFINFEERGLASSFLLY